MSSPRPSNHDFAESRHEQEALPPTYVSFILRCRMTPDGHTVARLLDVRSGTSTTITDLDALPDLVRQRLQGRPYVSRG